MGKRNHYPQMRGFTLIELLVSLAVFTLLMASAFQLFDNILDNNERSRADLQQQQELAFTWNLLFQDFLQLRARPIRDIQGDTQPAFQAGQTDLAHFVRGGLPPIKGVIPAGMQRVAYQLRNNELYRLSWPVLDLGNDSKPMEQRLLGEVAEAKFEFLDQENNYQQFWPSAVPTPDTTNNNLTQMPRMLRITLAFKNGQRIQRILPGLDSL
jgi:general secretion pathway protein J